MFKFKIGDLVQVKRLFEESDFVETGDIGIVDFIDLEDEDYPIRVDINDEIDYGFKECELEKVDIKDVRFDFSTAFELMLEGIPVKLPEWKGYWIWENDTIMIYCGDGAVLDIRNTEDTYYTFSNITRDDWCVYQ